MSDDATAIERRLDAGEWLRPGEVAVLFGVSRAAVDRWLTAGKIRHRINPLNRRRTCDPVDVRQELDAFRKTQGGAV